MFTVKITRLNFIYLMYYITSKISIIRTYLYESLNRVDYRLSSKYLFVYFKTKLYYLSYFILYRLTNGFRNVIRKHNYKAQFHLFLVLSKFIYWCILSLIDWCKCFFFNFQFTKSMVKTNFCNTYFMFKKR